MVSKYKEWLDYLAYGMHREETPYLRFVVLWLSFNSYLNEIYPTIGGDKNKVCEFSKNNTNRKFFEDNVDYEEVAQEFRKTKREGREYVDDMRSKKPEKRKYLRIKNSDEIKLKKYI